MSKKNDALEAKKKNPPCNCCGKAPLFLSYQLDGKERRREIVCETCGQGKGDRFKTFAEALRIWNDRFETFPDDTPMRYPVLVEMRGTENVILLIGPNEGAVVALGDPGSIGQYLNRWNGGLMEPFRGEITLENERGDSFPVLKVPVSKSRICIFTDKYTCVSVYGTGIGKQLKGCSSDSAEFFGGKIELKNVLTADGFLTAKNTAFPVEPAKERLNFEIRGRDQDARKHKKQLEAKARANDTLKKEVNALRKTNAALIAANVSLLAESTRGKVPVFGEYAIGCPLRRDDFSGKLCAAAGEPVVGRLVSRLACSEENCALKYFVSITSIVNG